MQIRTFTHLNGGIFTAASNAGDEMVPTLMRFLEPAARGGVGGQC